MTVRPTTIAANTSAAQIIPDNHALTLVLPIACLPPKSWAVFYSLPVGAGLSRRAERSSASWKAAPKGRPRRLKPAPTTKPTSRFDTIALLYKKGVPYEEICDGGCDTDPPGRRRRRWWCQGTERFGNLRPSLSGKLR